MVKAPVISVVMSVYNDESYVDEAVNSILNQTFTDFEFIIINDGSTDKTATLLKKYSDPRIKLFTQENQGLVTSLNFGIKQARGRYIARQDADDRSEPSRLKLQYEFLCSNPDVVIVGSGMSVMDTNGLITHRHSVLLNDAELKQELLVRSPFAHGSVLFERKTAINSGLYEQSWWPAEDYNLWLKLSDKGSFANLDEYLYVYRENEKGISSTNNDIQIKQKNNIREQSWTLRNSLLDSEIDIKAYSKNLLDITRAERIINTTAWISHKAWKRFSLITGFKNILLVRSSPRSMLAAFIHSFKGINV